MASQVELLKLCGLLGFALRRLKRQQLPGSKGIVINEAVCAALQLLEEMVDRRAPPPFARKGGLTVLAQLATPTPSSPPMMPRQQTKVATDEAQGGTRRIINATEVSVQTEGMSNNSKGDSSADVDIKAFKRKYDSYAEMEAEFKVTMVDYDKGMVELHAELPGIADTKIGSLVISPETMADTKADTSTMADTSGDTDTKIGSLVVISPETKADTKADTRADTMADTKGFFESSCS